MDNIPHELNSFRQLIHDMNQIIFLMRGHCELAKATHMDSAKLGEHLQKMEGHLDDITSITKSLKQQQMELAPEE